MQRMDLSVDTIVGDHYVCSKPLFIADSTSIRPGRRFRKCCSVRTTGRIPARIPGTCVTSKARDLHVCPELPRCPHTFDRHTSSRQGEALSAHQPLNTANNSD
ncbi:hypothetical protein PoB_003650400 [Plakobranchus ocellatus]|uniref:Uncharacterized protein n=1 Tax=Plakobranchus ocellatus TaxID=259542 RepID=A0AAV4AUK1_9GAST|nr:hypothetical protein PoB_003650400 [Plakobranchus ocellatus]